MPLHFLSFYLAPNADSLCLLLENGADVDLEDYDKGMTPFESALPEKRHEIE